MSSKIIEKKLNHIDALVAEWSQAIQKNKLHITREKHIRKEVVELRALLQPLLSAPVTQDTRTAEQVVREYA